MSKTSGIERALMQFSSKEGIKFHSSKAEREFQERAGRIADAIQLKVPDRVPIVPFAHFFPTLYAGVSLKEAMYDYSKAYIAWKKTYMDFMWDAVVPPHTYSARLFDIVRPKLLFWPGHGVSDKAPAYQFIEPGQKLRGQIQYDYMKPEEYNWFLDDPSDYLVRGYLPRAFEILKPFRNLPPMHGITHWYLEIVNVLATPKFEEAFKALAEAANEANKWLQSFSSFIQEIKSLGFPIMPLPFTHDPFDYIADFHRGTHGALIDMFRRPDKLLKVCEKITPWMIQKGVTGAKLFGNPVVGIYLHKGILMNLEQYKKFYWPPLRNVITALIEQDLIPYVYAEGDYTPYLEIIKDIPKGRAIYHLGAKTDIFKAKEMLRDTACLIGGLPNWLVIAGTTQDVKEYCKKLIESVGEGGGFIMSIEEPLNEAKSENMKAMTDFTKEYGVYKK